MYIFQFFNCFIYNLAINGRIRVQRRVWLYEIESLNVRTLLSLRVLMLGVKKALLLKHNQTLLWTLVTTFIREIDEVEAVKELKDVHNNDNDLNDENNLQWSVEPSSRKGDQRSDEFELLLATECQKPDIYIEMCLWQLPCMGCDAAVYFRLGIRDILFKQ